MRVLINDYGGHAFTFQLSQKLSERDDIEMYYTYFGSDISPKGILFSNNEKLKVVSIVLDEKFQKYSFIKRRYQEREFARRLTNTLKVVKPQVVVCANTPIESLYLIQKYCLNNNIKFVFWLQDIISIAVKNILHEKFSVFSFPIVKYYEFLERQILKRSTKVIAISEEFASKAIRFGATPNKVKVLNNWSDNVTLYPKSKINTWSKKFKLENKFCFIYSGTLGLKHNPYLLVDLANTFSDNPNVMIVVITEGLGAEILDKEIDKNCLNNLLRIPFQPFDLLSDVYASSDVLVAILEESANAYSVPSKILSYMCVNRPILASMPNTNPSSKLIVNNKCGLVFEPNDSLGFFNGARQLYENSQVRKVLAFNGYTFAKENFDIDLISEKFSKICDI